MQINKISASLEKENSRFLSEVEYKELLSNIAAQIAQILELNKKLLLSEIKHERIFDLDKTEFVLWVDIQIVKENTYPPPPPQKPERPPRTFWQRLRYVVLAK